MSESLKSKTAQGLFWGALSSSSSQILNLVIGIILGRLVSPEDWGVIGMLTIFTAIAGNIQSSGFSTAIINIKYPQHKDYNAVFWFNVITSFLLYILLFICAPYIAMFFRVPELKNLSRIVFLSFFISSFGISSNAYMTKNMMNKEITIIGFIALISSGAAGITLAYLGYSYWSLAWQQIVYNLVLVIGRWSYINWHPTLSFDFNPIRKTLKFSMSILTTMIINTISNNILTLLFGRIYGKRTTGNFFQAYKWDSMAFGMITGMLEQVSQPVLVSLRNNSDKEREIRAFRKMIRFASFLAFPAMFGLALVAKEFILITLKHAWIDSVLPLQILCISGAFMPIYSLYKNLIISNGRSDINMYLNIGQIIIQLLIIIFTYKYGFITMIAFYTLINILWLIPWQFYTNKITSLPTIDILKDICPFLVISLLVMITTYILTVSINNLYLLFISRILIASTLYILTMKVLKVKIMEECINFIHKKK